MSSAFYRHREWKGRPEGAQILKEEGTVTSDGAAKLADFLQNEVKPSQTRAHGNVLGTQEMSLWALEPGQEGRWLSIFISFTGFSSTAPYGLTAVGRAVL